MPRIDGRAPNQLRNIKVQPAVQRDPDGSVLIEWGQTKVLCSVIYEDKLPNWMQGEKSGWITAEYGMLPGSSDKRIHRDRIRSTGRTHEIQRLIGRSIRACMKMEDLGPRTITIDCDVIQADGGTRVASITGSYLAFRLALRKMVEDRVLRQIPPSDFVAAVSVGRVNGEILLDLNYPEDVKAEVDANVVMNSRGEFIEVQGTAEKGSFSRSELDQLLDSAASGCKELFELQQKYVKEWGL